MAHHERAVSGQEGELYRKLSERDVYLWFVEGYQGRLSEGVGVLHEREEGLRSFDEEVRGEEGRWDV